MIITRGRQLPEEVFYSLWAYQKQSQLRLVMMDMGENPRDQTVLIDTAFYVYNNCPWLVEVKEMQLN